MRKPQNPTLAKTLQAITAKWSMIGLALSLLSGLGCLIYSSKISSENQVKVLAEALGRAFRPSVLNGDVRDAQFQINTLLNNGSVGAGVILGPDFSEIYSVPGIAVAKCTRPSGYCWSGFRSLSYLHPIYFDDDAKTGLFGYLLVTTPAGFSWTLAGAFSAFIVLLFMIQAYGITSSLSLISKNILGAVSSWAGYLSENPRASTRDLPKANFAEFETMESAVSNLQFTISKLEQDSAKQAKENAQISIVREIGHDLKTPLSQLAKHFHLLVQEGRPSTASSARIAAIERTLKRMGDLIRQIREFQTPNSDSNELVNIRFEVESFVSNSNSVDGGAKIQLKGNSVRGSLVSIRKIRLYQILDNLVRNAKDAAGDDGLLEIELMDDTDTVLLAVRDNGPGIPESIQGKIFDLDFTTKSSKGTGLGLAIVKRICAEVGASIRVKSHPGTGSEFIIAFPKYVSVGDPVSKSLGEVTI